MPSNTNNRFRVPRNSTPVVQALLIANVAIFLLMLVFRDSVGVLAEVLLALWPLDMPPNHPARFYPWQLVSYGFLHANEVHIFFNMFALWMFGSPLERLWGSGPFAMFYFVCVIGAGVVQLIVGTPGAPTVGASGGVFGILLGFGMMYPNQIVMLIFPPIPMKAKYFVVLYGLLELWLGVTSTRSTVAHFAHLGGMLFGFVIILYWRGRLPWKPSRTLNR